MKDITIYEMRSLLEFIERTARDHQGMSKRDYDMFIRPYGNRGRQ